MRIQNQNQNNFLILFTIIGLVYLVTYKSSAVHIIHQNNMDKILNRADAYFNPQPSHWQTLGEDWESDIQKCFISEGIVYCLNNDQASLNPKRIVLTRTRLYQLDPQYQTDVVPEGMINITWKRVKAISITLDGKSHSGFRVVKKKDEYTFFTSSPSEAEHWIEILQKQSIQFGVQKVYKILQKIGQGTFSIVNLAAHRKTGELFAIKQIPLTKISVSTQATLSFIREIDVMRQIDHESIVKLQAVFASTSHLYLVQDFMQHGSLSASIFENGAFTEREAQNMILNLLKTVDYLHENNIVHRDLKPDNLLMEDAFDRTRVKICDFGIACNPDQTLSTLCGSAGFIAPEILKGRPYDTKVDIFSVGVITYIMQLLYSLAGRLPFYSTNTNELLLLNEQCNVNFKSEIFDHVSDVAKDFIIKLMEPNPSERPDCKTAFFHPWLYGLILEKEGPKGSPVRTGRQKTRRANSNHFIRSFQLQFDEYEPQLELQNIEEVIAQEQLETTPVSKDEANFTAQCQSAVSTLSSCEPSPLLFAKGSTEWEVVRIFFSQVQNQR